MKLVEVYRLALIEGLTANEAGEKYGVKPQSLLKKGSLYKLPSLKREGHKKLEAWLKTLSDEQLREYKRSFDYSSSFKRREPSETEEMLVNQEFIRRADSSNNPSK